ncbi:uncharacterized protein EHS24_005625 [Apiotrichum porosum]|uniref:Uncharacterized protein n=1 Tax=Apiotrichum porosum TaxID=105984 RepID=A0A427XZ82_9TREE|nr:uncharacterized protein EHS24_005625 [Apiotrichum porosum]RSH84123.1 hypothetical protein EHS24_005625 [Apiotrichum porosum]
MLADHTAPRLRSDCDPCTGDDDGRNAGNDCVPVLCPVDGAFYCKWCMYEIDEDEVESDSD